MDERVASQCACAISLALCPNNGAPVTWSNNEFTMKAGRTQSRPLPGFGLRVESTSINGRLLTTVVTMNALLFGTLERAREWERSEVGVVDRSIERIRRLTVTRRWGNSLVRGKIGLLVVLCAALTFAGTMIPAMIAGCSDGRRRDSSERCWRYDSDNADC